MKGYTDFEELNMEERLYYIQMAMESACELLEKLLECEMEKAKERTEKEDEAAPAFEIGKVGVDIGEAKVNDEIARIFGN